MRYVTRNCLPWRRRGLPAPPRRSTPQKFLGVSIEPLLDDFVLERQFLIDRHALRDGEPEGVLREADHDLVLQQGIAELHEHLPAGPRHAEILWVMGRGVAVEIGMAAHQPDQVVDPGPAAQRRIDPQFREIHRDLVEMARVAEIVGAIIGIIHRRIDADRDIELDAFGIKRIVAPVARREIIVQGGYTQAVQATLLDEMLELAHAAHPVERADRRQREKALRIVLYDIGQHMVVDAAEHGHLGPLAIELADEVLDRLADDLRLRPAFARSSDALAEDVLVIRETVSRTGLQQLGISVADAVRRLFMILPGTSLLIRR